jgi:hypothetical protein
MEAFFGNTIVRAGASRIEVGLALVSLLAAYLSALGAALDTSNFVL